MTQPDLPPPAPKQSVHLPGVDVLRACACLWVVLFHVGLWWNGGQWRGFGALQAEAGSLGSWLVVWAPREIGATRQGWSERSEDAMTS
jgi:hypothetical protein